jgi:hypothetical protein
MGTTLQGTPRAPGAAFGEICAAMMGVGFILIAIASIQYREMIAPAVERMTNALSSGALDRTWLD